MISKPKVVFMGNRDAYDLINGREVPPLVIDKDHVLTGVHEGSVYVAAGNFTLAGTIRGSLAIQQGVTVTLAGKQQGSVSVASGAKVTIRGVIEGSTSVAREAIVIVEASGRLAGSLHNDGLILVRGVFGGAQSGEGELRLEGNGYIKQPKIRNGIHYYEW